MFTRAQQAYNPQQHQELPIKQHRKYQRKPKELQQQMTDKSTPKPNTIVTPKIETQTDQGLSAAAAGTNTGTTSTTHIESDLYIMGESHLLPKPFSGLSTDQNIKDFLRDIKSYLVIRKLTGEPAREIIRLSLRGNARHFFDNLHDTALESTENVEKALTEEYGNREADWKRQGEVWLQKQKRGESFEDYLVLMERMADQSNMSDQQLKNAVLNGMQPALRRQLIMAAAADSVRDMREFVAKTRIDVDVDVMDTGNVQSVIQRLEQKIDKLSINHIRSDGSEREEGNRGNAVNNAQGRTQNGERRGWFGQRWDRARSMFQDPGNNTRGQWYQDRRPVMESNQPQVFQPRLRRNQPRQIQGGRYNRGQPTGGRGGQMQNATRPFGSTGNGIQYYGCNNWDSHANRTNFQCQNTADVPFCVYCKRQGHSVEVCWARNARPTQF